MATNRPLQNLISTTGNPATRSSSSLVTPQLSALADPSLYTIDPRLVHYLVAETIRALRESQLAARTRQHDQLVAVQQEIAALRVRPASTSTQSTAAEGKEESPGPTDEAAVRARLDQIGYRVGWATAERLARDRPRFPLAAVPPPPSLPPASSSSASPIPSGSSTPVPPNPSHSSQPQQPAPPQPQQQQPQQPDVLELVKFICKDLWVSIFDKQVDNLRTNHRGVYVIHDSALGSLKGLGALQTASGAEGEEEDGEERRELQSHVDAVLAFPSGLIRGALANLNVSSTVTGSADLANLPQASFQIKTTMPGAGAVVTTTTGGGQAPAQR
ncbi:hypothetical protein JCM10908_006327 [Rhodotorula pacifica]|uniref:Trs33p n=1 Tax=Rhodotorula pacifica TaxID=1495444 RepID=UPI0031707FD6